jgi:hypothetical protein
MKLQQPLKNTHPDAKYPSHSSEDFCPQELVGTGTSSQAQPILANQPKHPL